MAKYEKTERLEKVPMEYLWEGLVLSDNLYNYNGSVLLVPSGEVITKSKLDKLINFSDGNNYITTFRGSYEYIMKGKDRPAEIQQKMLENRTGYTELRKGIDHVLQMSKNAMFVNHAEVEGMMEKVYGRMVSVDAGEIFQCITVPRPVDEALQRHSLNVALLNGIMGQWLGLDEKDIRSLILTGVLHDIGKTKIPEEILNAPRKLTPEEFEVMKRHPLYSFELLGDDISEDVRYAVRWHHEKLDGKGYPDGLKGEEIPISAQVVSIVDVYDALTSERCYKKAFDHDTAIRMILDGQCGQFNPVLLKCLKELSLQFSRMFTNKPDDNKQYYEAQRLSDEILREKSLPRKNYSQRVIKLMQEKIEFFKTNSGKTSIEYNVISGQLSVMNEKQQIICQRNDPKYDISNVFEVNREDIRQVSNLLDQTSIQNKEVSLHVMAKVENKRQMCALKLHTLWSPLKKDGYIGIVGYFESI